MTRYFSYTISSGELLSCEDPPSISKPTFLGTGYSGAAHYRDDRESVSLTGLGPLPPGWYSIRNPVVSKHLGPCVMALIPDGGQEMYGRSGFYIHGDNARHDASHGCIILGPILRGMIAQSNIKRLQVIP